MEVTRFIYQDNPAQEVDFEPTGSENVMVNATQMAAIFGKKVNHFMENDATKNFIKACLKRANKTGITVLSGIKNEEDLVNSRKKSGTWMHRILALKFAAWLDPDFEVWVFETIDKIINESFRIEREARLKKLSAKREMAALKREMLEQLPAAERYFELESMMKQADAEIKNTIRDQVKQLEMEFIPAPNLS